MQAQGNRVTYFVEGMDCATCVAKVEQVVQKLPGAGEPKTSFTRQTLTLTLDESQTPRSALERQLQALGYTPSLLSDAAGTAPQAATPLNHTEALGRAGKPWYHTQQGRLVVGSGLLLALAWAFSFFAPAFATAGFVAAILLGVWPLLKKALASLRLGDPFSINLLVSLAALGAAAIGEAAEGAAVVFLFAVGELLEGVAAARAKSGIQALLSLSPKTAWLLEDGECREVPAASLQVGQRVRVGSGAQVPTDGTIVTGSSSLDDSPITGESLPIYKREGDSVYAGSLNGEGMLTIRVDRAAAENTVARIIRLVEEAESHKAPTARFIDRFSRLYTPGVVALAGFTALVPPLLGHDWFEWLYRGIALLLIGCPCALVLSVPAAITSGLSAGTRRGLLVKGGAALESIGRVNTIAFDKTGTLTRGQPKVTDVIGHRETVLRLAAAAETGSHHPLARAIVQAAQAERVAAPEATGAHALAGRGVRAQVAGRPVSVVSPRYAAQQQVSFSGEQAAAIRQFEERGRTAVVVLDGDEISGIIAMRDEPREDAQAALEHLRRLGVRPVMLTGDNTRTADAIAAELGLEAHAELLPEDKLRHIDALKLSGGVAMVGDGINDAPALARADVGIAMGSGTDVALETADAALLQERVQGVAELIQLSRATAANIRQNVAFALGLKLLFLVTTLLGYTNLWMAVLADTGAAAIVTVNALRLLRWKPSGVPLSAQNTLANPPR